MNHSSLIFIPSGDDDRDWILESYYQGYPKKNWKQPIKDLISPPSLNYLEELSDTSSAILIIRQWRELKESQEKVRFIHLNQVDDRQSWTGREVLQEIQKEGVLLENDQGKFPPKIQKVRAAPFQISNYARIYSIDGLKKSLSQNGPALMVVPVFDDPSIKEHFWHPNGQRLGGLDLVVIGFNKKGFQLMIPGSDKRVVNFPYSDWGMQWEVWAILNHNFRRSRTREQREKDLLDLKNSLTQKPLPQKKGFLKHLKFRKKKKVSPRENPEEEYSNNDNNLKEMKMKSKQILFQASDSDSDSDEVDVWI